MSRISLFVFLTAAVLFCAAEEYTNKFDGIDIDKVLNSERLLNNYQRCLLDKGPCTPAGAELKRHIPDALQTECGKCTQVQKEKSDKVTEFLINKRPKMFRELEEKFDPTGIYRKRDEAKRARKA